MNEAIYMDNNATTRVDDEVLKEMLPYFTNVYGNASSNLHEFGWKASAAVELAGQKLAKLLNCEPAEILFTSGATESVNLAIKGIFETYQTKGNHIITCKTEHKAVLDTCSYLETKGARVTYLGVDREGRIDLDELRSNIGKDTILVCLMAANNETGVLHPLEEISEICNRHQILFFSDATQYVGKSRCDVKELGVHLLALSAHKFHGPKGIGALYVRRKDPRVNILPQLHGGGHQNGKRAGTLNVPLIVGMGKAAEIASRDYWEINTHVSKLKNHFEHQLLDIEGLRINGSTRHRLFTTSNITFPPQKEVKKLLSRFAFSSGSACSSANAEPSHVLKAMGCNEQDIRNTFRFSFCKYNSLNEVTDLIAYIQRI